MKAAPTRPKGHTSAATPGPGQPCKPAKSAQQRGRGSRTKGQSGEREVAAIIRELTGHDVRRRVRQHQGDSDLEGLPGWCIECKRHANTPPGLLAQWWRQTVAQAQASDTMPVLLYRGDRAGWRVAWPAALHLPNRPAISALFNDCLVSDPLTWWLMVRHVMTDTPPYPPCSDNPLRPHH